MSGRSVKKSKNVSGDMSTSHNPTSTSTKAKTRGNVTITVTTGADRGGSNPWLQKVKTYWMERRRMDPSYTWKQALKDCASK